MAKGKKTAGNHIMDKAKKQVMSSNGIKLTMVILHLHIHTQDHIVYKTIVMISKH